jgi:hypothetical protein
MPNKSYPVLVATVGLTLALALGSLDIAARNTSPADDNDIQPITGPLPADYTLNRNGSVTLRVCYNWSCAAQQRVTFAADEMQAVKDFLGQCTGTGLHDRIQRLRVGIWQMQLIAQRHIPELANDREINEFDKGVEGRLDCVDSSSNTMTYLKILEALGQLPGWSVAKPVVRNVMDFYGVHWTAVVTEQGTGKKWSVDSWFRPHGHLPFVMPLADWERDKKAWEPPFSRQNPYPESMAELCPTARQASATPDGAMPTVAGLHRD